MSWRTIQFSVDSDLLEELGERLVSRPSGALAELLKNSYDADATEARIEFDPEGDRIAVIDNGHGMDYDEFKGFWMRIGSTHKRAQRESRNFERPMVGLKGVGRLAVQLLADELDLQTTSDKDTSQRLEAHVRWEEARRVRELTEVTAKYKLNKSGEGFEKGTTVILKGLRQKWGINEVRDLAGELWWLQPPFRTSPDFEDPKTAFNIEFLSPVKSYEEAFGRQMRAVIDIWRTRLVGKNTNGEVSLSIEFRGEKPIITGYHIPQPCTLRGGDFEIRIYLFRRRQRYGIKVKEAREYYNKYGGVHVYDGGFHLPYYGDPENDWLRVEFDHSHRLSMSKILPRKLQVKGGMTHLPTLSRIFGVVHVATSKELDLEIMITRDRFRDSGAFDNLTYMVRYALDLYANEQAKRQFAKKAKKREIERPKVATIEDAVAKHRLEIPRKVYKNLISDVRKATETVETEAESLAERVSLMGPLATAGISSLAYQHEMRQQFGTIENLVKDMEKLQVEDEKLRETLNEIRENLTSWIERTKVISALFASFRDSENLAVRERFPAKTVVKDIVGQVESLARGIPIGTANIEEGLMLPRASLVDWISIFQNVFINAFNAMIDSETKVIEVSSRKKGRIHEILVQDTGKGVDLGDAERFFEPFERGTEVSHERRALGYGGTGLGLTIVRMVARNIGCKVSFLQPEHGFKTAFALQWRELD